MARPRPSFEKRRKEQARLEKQAAKRARRHERRQADPAVDGSVNPSDLTHPRGFVGSDDEPGR